MDLLKLGEQHPQRGNRFSKWLGRMLMRVLRWHTEGELCPASRFICVMAPHTSWWDFTNNFSVMLATGMHTSWFIADTYTRGVARDVLVYFGAIPIDRGAKNDIVAQMADRFASQERLILGIFPEGTRKPVPTWKTGFWHIAKQAQVPIQLVSVDYARRATVFGPVVTLTDDMESDIKAMRRHFNTVTAKRPHNARYHDEDTPHRP